MNEAHRLLHNAHRLLFRSTQGSRVITRKKGGDLMGVLPPAMTGLWIDNYLNTPLVKTACTTQFKLGAKRCCVT